MLFMLSEYLLTIALVQLWDKMWRATPQTFWNWTPNQIFTHSVLIRIMVMNDVGEIKSWQNLVTQSRKKKIYIDAYCCLDMPWWRIIWFTYFVITWACITLVKDFSLPCLIQFTETLPFLSFWLLCLIEH